MNSNQQLATSFVETLHFVVYVCVDGRLTLLDGAFGLSVYSLLVGPRPMIKIIFYAGVQNEPLDLGAFFFSSRLCALCSDSGAQAQLLKASF